MFCSSRSRGRRRRSRSRSRGRRRSRSRSRSRSRGRRRSRSRSRSRSKEGAQASSKSKEPAPGHLSQASGNATTKVVVNVPNSAVGSIIGRGGDVVRTLERNTGVHLDIAKPEMSIAGNLRPITVTGTQAACMAAQALLETLVSNAQEQKTTSPAMVASLLGGGAVAVPPQAAAPVMGSFGLTMGATMGSGAQTVKVVNVPNSVVGALIGRRGIVGRVLQFKRVCLRWCFRTGETINHIQSMSGAHVDVAKPSPMYAMERPLTITGSEQCVQQCLQLITMKVQELVTNDAMGVSNTRLASSGGGQTLIVGIPDECAGTLIGRGGARGVQLALDICNACCRGDN